MRGKQVRLAVRPVAALVLVAATALAVGVLRSSSGPAKEQRFGEGELPTALGNHLANLAKATPDNPGLEEEGPSSAAESAFLERAYPADTISVQQMQGVRAAVAAAKGRPFPGGKGRKGTWVSVGPSEALYPFERFRKLVQLRSERLCRRRAHDFDCSRSVVQARRLPRIHHRGRRRGVADEERTDRTAELGVPRRPARDQRRRVGVYRSERPEREHGLRRARARPTSAARAASPEPASTGRSTAARRGRSLGGNTFNGLGIGAIVVKPGSPNTIYAGVTTALRGMSSVCCSGVTRPVPGAGKWGLYKSTDGGATWNFIHNGSTNAADCVGDLDGVEQPPDVLAPRRPFIRARSVQSGDRLRGVVRPWGLALA